MIDMEERLARLDAHVAAGTVLRGEWGDGHKTACLLSALVPEVAEGRSVYYCPSEIMSKSLAYLTPWLRDATSLEHSDAVIVPRYAALAHRWHVLDSDGWRRFDHRSKRAAVIEARRHTNVLGLYRRLVALLDRSIVGDEPSEDDWAARDAAQEATRVAGSTAADRLADAILDALEAEIRSAEDKENQ